jgi:hypothetical protein
MRAWMRKRKPQHSHCQSLAYCDKI